jgi:hypothetical protein
MTDYKAWYAAMKEDINRVNKAMGVEVNKIESTEFQVKPELRNAKVIRWELEIGNSSILLCRNRFLESWDAQSMASSILHSDVYENAFTRYSTISCRLSKVTLTDEEVKILTPEPLIKKGRK